jgi:hypothetical protein
MTPHQRRKHFDMGTWADKTDCGTVGCAAGLCAFDPWFRRRGLVGKFHTYEEDGEKKYDWQFLPDRHPWNFFGDDGYQRILVNEEFTSHKGAGIHRRVVRAVKEYIKELQNDNV